MRKTGYFFMSLMLCVSILLPAKNITAGNIEKTKARHAGAYFLASQFGDKAITAESLKQVYEFTNNISDVATLYVFNTADDRGFVIVSGSDCTDPIVAYSTEGSFDPNNIPPNMMWWLNEQADFIAYTQNNQIAPAKETLAAWEELDNELLPYFGQNSKEIIRLTTSKWNQEPLYNNMCPIDPTTGQRSVTGCVATAMAQIIYYWKYPLKGKGTWSYTWQGTTLEVVFTEAFYNYNNMVDQLTGSSTSAQINEVAKLGYHCGVAVEMDYGSNASGASSARVPTAFWKFFKYDKDSLRIIYRADSRYNNPNSTTSPNTKDSNWVNDIKYHILKKRPVYYAGHSESGGTHARHAFVCDGWNTVTKTMHFNWGWGGSGDAWCNVYRSNLTAPNYVFTDEHIAVIGITPPKDSLPADVNIVTVENPTISEIYPNPAQDQITVCFQLNGNANTAMQIFDIAGREVKRTVVSPASNYVTISVKDLRPGVYICRLQGHSAKFIVK